MTDNKRNKKNIRFIIVCIIATIVLINSSSIYAKNTAPNNETSIPLPDKNYGSRLNGCNVLLLGYPIWPILTPATTLVYSKICLIQIYGRRLYNYFYGSIYNA